MHFCMIEQMSPSAGMVEGLSIRISCFTGRKADTFHFDVGIMLRSRKPLAFATLLIAYLLSLL